MLSVSEAYLRAILADTRSMPYRVTFAGSVEMDQTQVPKMTLTESSSDNAGLSIGTANSASLKLTLKDAIATDYTDVLVVPESGLELPDGTIEWVPLGKFWVTDFSTSNDYKTVSLTCADGMYLMTGDYESELTYPAPVQAVAHEIVSKAGVDFVEPDQWPDVIIRRKPEGLKYRDAIGYVAGCCGKNARFNRYGKLEFYWYGDTGITIGGETQYLNGMSKLNYKPLSVDFEVTGAKEKYSVTVVSGGNGGVTATPGTNILEGDTVALSVRPFSGYELADISAVTEQGVRVPLYIEADGSGYTFVQPDSNVTVTASFRENATGPFRVTVRAYDHGSAVCSASGHAAGNSYFNYGSTAYLTVYPNDGYEVDTFHKAPESLNIAYVGENSDGGLLYQFAIPRSDVTINVTFKAVSAKHDIFRSVSMVSHTIVPGFIHVTDKASGEYITSASAGTLVSVRFAPYTGFEYSKHSTNIEMTQIDTNEFQFVMPEGTVSIIGIFVQSEDESKTGKFPWLALPAHNISPTEKPYWAVLYKHDPSVPTCQRYWLVWFDSWSATGYDVVDGQRLYSVKFNGYYYCGSKNMGHYPHAWDTSTWSGNGSSGSTLEWDVFTGGHAWAGDPLYSSDYALLASNAHLYHNASIIFHKCEGAIPHESESYYVDGMDVRERGAFGYYKCPDTYSTPAPASNWMILNSRSCLLMERDEDTGRYTGYGGAWTGLYVMWFDSIAVENVGAVLVDNDEEFFIATVTNGHYARLCADDGTWGDIWDVGDNQFIGIRNPLVSEERIYGSSATGSYYFNGLMVASCNINGSGTLLRYKNDCKICDCSNVLMFSKSSSGSERVTMTYTNPLIYEKMVPTIQNAVQGLTYTPAKVKHRGNPALQAGDIVTVPDKDGNYHTVLIMQQTMNFGGGMNSEITCPGQTQKTKNFSVNGSINTQISQKVEQSTSEAERRLAVNNALVYASLYKMMSGTSAEIKGIVEWQTEKSAAIASLEQKVTSNSASINLLVEYSSDGKPKASGSLMIAAINGESSAKISADRLDIEGKTLNINIEKGNIAGWEVTEHHFVKDNAGIMSSANKLGTATIGSTSSLRFYAGLRDNSDRKTASGSAIVSPETGYFTAEISIPYFAKTPINYEILSISCGSLSATIEEFDQFSISAKSQTVLKVYGHTTKNEYLGQPITFQFSIDTLAPVWQVLDDGSMYAMNCLCKGTFLGSDGQSLEARIAALEAKIGG